MDRMRPSEKIKSTENSVNDLEESHIDKPTSHEDVFEKETLRPSKLITPEILTAKQKFLRAVENAKTIGKGLENIAKNPEQSAATLQEPYWIEAVDGKHRYAGGTLGERFDEWEKDSATKLSFPEWEKEKYSDETIVKSSQKSVEYLEQSERKKYEIGIEKDSNGEVVLKRANGEIFDTSVESTSFSGQGSAIFVMDSSGRLYAGSHHLEEFHHSSFLAGGAAIGAGEIKTDSHGHIVEISNKSGHYQPDELVVLSVLKALEKQGVDLSKVHYQDITKKDGRRQNALEYLKTRRKEINEGAMPLTFFQQDLNETVSQLADPNFLVREQALEKIKMLKPQDRETLIAIGRHLADENPFVVSDVIAALEFLSPDIPEVNTALLKAMASNNQNIRLFAVRALQKISPQKLEDSELLDSVMAFAFYSDSPEQIRSALQVVLGTQNSKVLDKIKELQNGAQKKKAKIANKIIEQLDVNNKLMLNLQA